MQAAATAKTAGFTPPDAIWIALWDNVASLNDGTLTWPLAERSKQYAGNTNGTVGGITLNIDKDIVGGPAGALMPRGCARQRVRRFARTGQTGSREPPWTHKLTTWPYAATALTPSST